MYFGKLTHGVLFSAYKLIIFYYEEKNKTKSLHVLQMED